MLEGSDTPQTPAWWIKTLGRELMDRRAGREGGKKWTRGLADPCRVRPGFDLLHDHERGDPPLLGVAAGWEEHFRVVTRIGRLNVAALIVEAKSDRIKLRGFRTAAADDELGDIKAAELMRATGFRVAAHEAVNYALTFSRGYLMTTPKRAGKKYPVVTAEDPREAITAHDPATGDTLAALKMYRDDWDSTDVVHLYLPTAGGGARHYSARRKGRTSLNPVHGFRLSQAWEWDENVGGASGKPMERMPLHRIRNRKDIGEFERHLDTLDRINDQIVDKLVIAKVQAFRQLAIKGLPDKERKFVDGKLQEVPIDYTDAFVAAPGAAWQVPADVDFWESQITDMRPLLEGIKDDLEHLAAVTRTPLHLITPDAAQGSAEGAGLMRESHTDAVGTCIDYMSLGMAEVMASMFALAGDKERADVAHLEPLWAPVERYSLAERADAASKAPGSLPREAIQRDIWQYDPAEIPNLRALAGRDLLNQAVPPTPQQSGQPAPVPTFQPPRFQQPQDGTQGDPAAAS